jgi:hypothetical protein
LPFDQGELELALHPRWRLLRQPPGQPVVVRGARDGTVTIETGTARREIELPDLASSAAARVVALLIIDLLSESVDRKNSRASPAPWDTSSGTLSLQLRIPASTTGFSPSLEPTLEIGMPVLPQVTASLSSGYTRTVEGDGGDSLRMHAFPIRIGLGYGRGWFDLRMAFVMRPYWVTGAGDDRGFHWGGGVSATAFWPVSARLALLLCAGLDGMAKRTEFQVDDKPVLSTTRMSPWLGVGFALRRQP